MSYYGYNYRNGYPLLLDNRASGVLNEYAELNDVAIKNNAIYADNMADNYRKCKGKGFDYDYGRPPSLYSLPYSYLYYGSPYLLPPYLASPYYGSPYLYGRPYGYYGYPYFR